VVDTGDAYQPDDRVPEPQACVSAGPRTGRRHAAFGVFANRRIGTKIISVALAIASVFAAVGVVGLMGNRDLAEHQDREYRTNVVALSRMVAIRSAVSAQQEAVLSHILSDRGFHRDQFEVVISQTDMAMDVNLTALHKIELTQAHVAALTAFEGTVELWRTARDIGLAASRAGDRTQATTVMFVRSGKVARSLKERADALLVQFVEAVALGVRKAQASSRDAERLTLLLLILGGLVAVALAVVAARTISRPVRQTMDVLARAARGDLSHQLDVQTKDEIGQMGKSLNETLAILRDAFEQLQHRASHDGLTGLANRTLLRERLKAAAPHALDGVPVAILLIDLDGFKKINDTHGHAAGDQLLVAVATRLLSAVRGADTVARLGGDEFAVLLDGMDAEEDVYAVADRLLEDIQAPVPYNGTELHPRASIGVAMWRGDINVDQLMHNADVAMYAAKMSGKGKVTRFADWAAADCVEELQQDRRRSSWRAISAPGPSGETAEEALRRGPHAEAGTGPVQPLRATQRDDWRS
jgi:diguanylate cyclase (GGDEF)-like protein